MRKKEKIIILILILLIFGSLFYGMYGRTTTFRDWAVVFEGAYRISLGQIPYQDFSMPLGPGTLYMQAFFNIIFGNNLLAAVMHSFVLSTILTLIFYYFLRKEFGITISFIFAFFFHISFIGLAFHPFYNHQPYFFFFLNVFLIFNYLKKDSLPIKCYILSAILGILNFYTKQDMGALHIFLFLIYFIINYRKDFKKILLYYLIPTIILLGGIYILFSNLGDFSYWFNLGQYPHNIDSRIMRFFHSEKIIMYLSSWYFYVSLFLVFSIILKKINKKDKIKIASLFILLSIANLINNTTSNMTRQLLAMGLPFLIFLGYLLIKKYIKKILKKNNFIFIIIIIIILILNVNPILTYGLVTLNYLNPNIQKLNEGCSSGIYLEKEILRDLDKIRTLIKKYPNFISMTEYTFLYCDYNKNPPKNLPLWFDLDVSFYEENINDIINEIISKDTELILIQDPHNFYKIQDDMFIKKFTLNGYSEIESINNTISEEPIRILLKNDILKDEKIIKLN